MSEENQHQRGKRGRSPGEEGNAPKQPEYVPGTCKYCGSRAHLARHCKNKDAGYNPEPLEETGVEEEQPQAALHQKMPAAPKIEKQRGNPEDEPLRNLIVKQLPFTLDEFEFKEVFAPFGPLERWKLIYADTYTKGGKNKGYGFIKYSDVKSANDAYESINGEVVAAKSGEKKIISIDYAQKPEALALLEKQQASGTEISTGSAGGQEDDRGPEVLRNLMVKHLPKEMDEIAFREIFVGVGKLESVKLMQEGKQNLSKGFGFVKFKRQEDAETAIKTLDQTMKGEGKKKIAISYAKYHEAMDALKWQNREKKEKKKQEKEAAKAAAERETNSNYDEL